MQNLTLYWKAQTLEHVKLNLYPGLGILFYNNGITLPQKFIGLIYLHILMILLQTVNNSSSITIIHHIFLSGTYGTYILTLKLHEFL